MYILIRGDIMEIIIIILKVLCKILYVIFLYKMLISIIHQMYLQSMDEAVKMHNKYGLSTLKRNIYNWIVIIKYTCVVLGGLIWMAVMINMGFSMISE